MKFGLSIIFQTFIKASQAKMMAPIYIIDSVQCIINYDDIHHLTYKKFKRGCYDVNNVS